jgi:putative membrane protein insertion efficiency factor
MLRRTATWILIFLVLLYRSTLGLMMSGHCRYWPTCSQYMIDAVTRHGPAKGAWLGLKRIGRCHPWGGSGYDPA